MHNGSIKWFNGPKRFGFVVAEDGRELFVHATSLAAEVGVLRTGDEVAFEVGESDRGEIATNVRLVRAANPPVGDEGGDLGKKRPELTDMVDATVRQLQGLSETLRARGGVGPTAAFNAARSLRRLANRLNPPAV